MSNPFLGATTDISKPQIQPQAAASDHPIYHIDGTTTALQDVGSEQNLVEEDGNVGDVGDYGGGAAAGRVLFN